MTCIKRFYNSQEVGCWVASRGKRIFFLSFFLKLDSWEKKDKACDRMPRAIPTLAFAGSRHAALRSWHPRCQSVVTPAYASNFSFAKHWYDPKRDDNDDDDDVIKWNIFIRVVLHPPAVIKKRNKKVSGVIGAGIVRGNVILSPAEITGNWRSLTFKRIR